MMLDGEWLAGPGALFQGEYQVDYGVAPFPPPAAHPERANSAVVRGPVVIIPSGAKDKEAAAQLLAWMASPEILAEAAYANALLPTSRTPAQDPRFRQMPNFQMFVDLMAHPNARAAVTTPITLDLNEALGRVEAELLHKGGDPALLLNEAQAEITARLEEGLAYHDRP